MLIREFLGEDIPKRATVVFGFIVLLYVVASVYLAVHIFPGEKLIDYGIGTTSYTNLWVGPIGGLRDIDGPGGFFGVMAYLISTGLLFWLLHKVFFSKTWPARVFFAFCSVVWWFLTGAINFGPGYVPYP